MPSKAIAVSITSTAAVLVVLHMVFPNLGIDAITVALVVLGALPWLLPFLKSLELPGGVKVELVDAKAATEKIIMESIPAAADASVVTMDDAQNVVETLRHVAGRDPNLALVGFRIELERRLLRIAEERSIDSKRMSLHRLIRELQDRGVLPPEVAGGVSDLVALGNRAAHGVEVSPDASAWVLEIGPSILARLEALATST